MHMGADSAENATEEKRQNNVKSYKITIPRKIQNGQKLLLSSS